MFGRSYFGRNFFGGVRQVAVQSAPRRKSGGGFNKIRVELDRQGALRVQGGIDEDDEEIIALLGLVLGLR